jgi:hypothetical protein
MDQQTASAPAAASASSPNGGANFRELERLAEDFLDSAIKSQGDCLRVNAGALYTGISTSAALIAISRHLGKLVEQGYTANIARTDLVAAEERRNDLIPKPLPMEGGFIVRLARGEPDLVDRDAESFPNLSATGEMKADPGQSSLRSRLGQESARKPSPIAGRASREPHELIPGSIVFVSKAEADSMRGPGGMSIEQVMNARAKVTPVREDPPVLRRRLEERDPLDGDLATAAADVAKCFGMGPETEIFWRNAISLPRRTFSVRQVESSVLIALHFELGRALERRGIR